MRRLLDDRWSIGWALYNLGQAEFAANNLDAAPCRRTACKEVWIQVVSEISFGF